ncbi:response regulator [Bacillus gobiensis]|uniref:response regulator n=1 Tax=Bacillus gobiensis TaxID=1441095 RepID=UPI003D1B6DAB
MTKILIIDDTKFIRLKIREIVEKIGMDVVGEASDGEEGLSRFIELKPDLVTLDITMPVKNGIETLKEMIAINPKANVIMCSAMGQQRLVVEAIENGARDYIVKPFEESKVIEAINRLMNVNKTI